MILLQATVQLQLDRAICKAEFAAILGLTHTDISRKPSGRKALRPLCLAAKRELLH